MFLLRRQRDSLCWKKLLKTPLRVIDALFWTDYAIKVQNYFTGFHNSNYTFKENEIAFVHLPKSGGTSLNKILGNADKYSQFINLNMHRPISKLCNPRKYSYITIMRNPVERVWSYYQMALRKDKDNPYYQFSVKGLEFFLKHCWEVRNMACRYYSGQVRREPNDQTLDIALGNLKYFSYIIDFNKFEEDVNVFLSQYDILATFIPHERKSSYTSPSQNNCDLICDYNRLDVKLFDRWKMKEQENS